LALREHPRRGDVTARLVELDPRIAAAARQCAAAAGLAQVEVVTGDAAQTGVYTGLVPASLVLACGVFGNITDGDVARTIRCCTGLCAPGGTVVWTRARREPDLIPQICDWFAAEGFALVGVSEPGTGWAVGAHRFEEQSTTLPDQKMFTFAGYDVLGRAATAIRTCEDGSGLRQRGQDVLSRAAPRSVREERDWRPRKCEAALPGLDDELGGRSPDRGRTAMRGRTAAPDEQGAGHRSERRREDQDRLQAAGYPGSVAPDRLRAPGDPAADPGQPGPDLLDPGYLLVPGEPGKDGEQRDQAGI
jgi:hypothetical protein